MFRSVHIGRSRFSRCCYLFGALSFHFKSGTRARRLTQSPELGFGLLSFLFLERFSGTILFLFYAAAATVMRLLLCKGSYTSPLTHR